MQASLPYVIPSNAAISIILLYTQFNSIDKLSIAQQSLGLFTRVLLELVIMPPPSTEQSFRANLSQFRWARGANDETQQQQQTTQPGNPFSRFYNAVAGDYIPLRSNEQSNEDEAWFALSRWERWV